MISLTSFPSVRMRLLLALASGLMLAFGFAPYRAPLVAWLAAAMLVFVALTARPRVAFACGALHGAAFYALTLPWVYVIMTRYGELGPLAAVGVTALLVIWSALFPGLFCLAVARVSRRGFGCACLAAPFVWVAVEFARGYIPHIGYQWNLLGYSVSGNLGLLQLVTVTGISGLSFVVAGYGALLAWLLSERSTRALMCSVAATAVLATVSLAGARFVPREAPRLLARLVQTNLPQGRYAADWMEQYRAALDEIERISVAPPIAASTSAVQGSAAQGSLPLQKGAFGAAQDATEHNQDAAREARSSTPGAKVSLIVWPEVPAPFYLQDRRFAERAQRIATQANTYLLVGHIEWKPDAGGRLYPYNSAALLGPSGAREFTYDKIHLVAFGEYVPLRNVLSFAEKLTQEVGDFHSGAERKAGKLPGGTFAVLICYEAVFAGEVRQFVADGAELLVNISNDGWLGRSEAADQHMEMARVRAVENRRWLLRATNNGYSVSVDPYGRIVSRMEAETRSALDVPFTFRSDRTLYTRFGDWLGWLCVIVGGGMLFWTARHKELRK